MTPNPQDTMPDLDAECLHCRTRLSALESTVKDHTAQLLEQKAVNAEVLHELRASRASNARVEESNVRVEELLKRVLEFITPKT
jgi:predicted nucleotidyltransferase